MDPPIVSALARLYDIKQELEMANMLTRSEPKEAIKRLERVKSNTDAAIRALTKYAEDKDNDGKM